MAKKTEVKPGRPSAINDKMKSKICELIIDGFSITKIALKLDITRQTIFNERKKDDKFAVEYAEALKLRAEIIADDTIEIADDKSNDLLTDPETGKQYANNAAVARDKLRIATRQKLLQYYDPEKYGEKSSFDITSKGESVWGGFQITPPKGEEENVD